MKKIRGRRSLNPGRPSPGPRFLWAAIWFGLVQKGQSVIFVWAAGPVHCSHFRRFFIFVFYKNIFSIWKFTGIYPTWPAGSGAAGAFLKKISLRKLRACLWGPVARQRGGRPPGCGATGRNFCNLVLFAKEFHICALFVTFWRNRP